MKRVTQEKFDAKLVEILDGMSGAQLLSIAGVYEAVAEELNNEVLQAIEDEE